MKDQTTWWRSAVHALSYYHWGGEVARFLSLTWPNDKRIDLGHTFDQEDIDCALEQLWAIREGLA